MGCGVVLVVVRWCLMCVGLFAVVVCFVLLVVCCLLFFGVPCALFVVRCVVYCVLLRVWLFGCCSGCL